MHDNVALYVPAYLFETRNSQIALALFANCVPLVAVSRKLGARILHCTPYSLWLLEHQIL